MNKFEIALKVAKRLKLLRLFEYLQCILNEKILKFKCFKSNGNAYFQTDLKRLAHKILMLKSNFKLVGRKFIRCFIALQNFKKFGRV